MEGADRRRRMQAHVLYLLTAGTGVLYLAWAYQNINPSLTWMGVAFFLAELACLTLFLLGGAKMWRLRYKPAGGMGPDRPYSVDVVVPVAGEPIEVIAETLRAASQIRWVGDLKLMVLDELGSEEVRNLAPQLGFEYRSRRELTPGQEGAPGKAGNLNFGLTFLRGELLLILDADQRCSPDILEKIAGYMRFTRVAFVQTKQQFEVSKDDPFFVSDNIFYDALQLGMDESDTVISCGSGVLYRRQALDDIGGFVTWNLVEDLTTSYELHSKGWKSFYYPFPLTIGLAPRDFPAIYKQRSQWALDTMRLFFWDCPIWKRGLTLGRRLGYIMICYSYLCAAFVFPFFFLVPVWSYLSGTALIIGNEVEFAIARGSYFVVMVLASGRLYRKQHPDKHYKVMSGLFPLYLSAVFQALLYPPRRRPRYHVTNASRGRVRRLASIRLLLPQMAIAAANIILPVFAILLGTASPRLILVNLPFSALAIWSLSHVIVAGLVGEERQPEPALTEATE